MFECDKCGTELEQNAKFCTNCGEMVKKNEADTVETENKDLSWYFLIICFMIGIPGGIQQVKDSYETTTNLSISQFMIELSRLENVPPELYGEMVGGSFAPMLLSSIIVGFVWGIKSIFSKKYDKPIESIFIGSIIFSILSMYAH